jgi:hypothetical protein
MKNKIDDLIYEFDMAWYDFRDTIMNRLARWCMAHCCPDYFTILRAMSRLTDCELQRNVNDIIAWRKEHPEKNFWEIC